MTQTTRHHPSLLIALTPITLTLFILGIQLFYFKDFTPHIPIAIGLALTSLVGLKEGLKWAEIEKGVFHVIHVAMPSIAVLITVGMIIGVWIACGTVPTLIYYGLKLLSPEIFLAASMLLCSVVSVSLGTSWGTIGTIGLALMGIGSGFDIPIYWTAGTIVSGAFFGDKISPLSDTTNLAPAVTGVNLFDHIRNMMPTTVPAMLIALLIYIVVGFFIIGNEPVSFEKIDLFTSTLDKFFYISPVLLLPAVLVIVLAIKKISPIPSLFAGAVFGALLAMLTQEHGIHDIFTYANSGYSMETGIGEIDTLLNRGGIQSMMWTISLMLIALGFGGALEITGCLQSIIVTIRNSVHTFGGLQTTAISTAFATNVVAGDPYLSIALPGRMYAPAYRGMGYSTLNLSRAIEEGGTLTSPLIPWNAGGVFVITTLGLNIGGGDITNLLYIPLAFACWISPIFGVFYAFSGKFSPKANAEEIRSWTENEETVAVINQ